jgi:hypothetical protein
MSILDFLIAESFALLSIEIKAGNSLGGDHLNVLFEYSILFRVDRITLPNKK